MATHMHRLQISLPQWQMQYLEDRARREERSIADLIRELVQQQAASRAASPIESIWEVAGIGEERAPLINGTPVSERPELYLASSDAAAKPGRPARRARKSARR